MNQKIARALIGVGIAANTLMAFAEEPLRVMDAAGHLVGRLYGNAKGDHVIVRFNDALGSLQLVANGSQLLPSEAKSSILWDGPHCGGQPVLAAGGQPPASGGVPNIPSMGSYRGEDQRFTVFVPTSSTVRRMTIYSQGVPGPTCIWQIPATTVYGVPAQAVSLDSYVVLPLHIE